MGRLSRRVRAAAALGAAGLVMLAASVDYTVSKGDTLSEIAAEHGVTVEDLVDANDLSNPNLIYIGQTLIIPDPKPEPIYHVVQPGETLIKIAKLYNATAEQIAEINGFPNPNLIYPGNRLLIEGEPPPAFEPEVSEGSTTHTVKRGDWLGKIARQHGTTVQALVDANGLSNPNLIYIGQVLQIPGSGWVCPVPGATFINDWGFPRNGGRFHEGNDLYAALGTPVLAPVSGVVEQVDGSRGGLQFWLEGDDGVLYIGTHLSEFGKQGRVSAGDMMGRVGASGNARGSSPHLHFEVHPEYNMPTNPYPILSEACG
ncbi:MAG: LysM peptidoglycan-binding domain-containing protein [Acidimicrobiia bacterium]